MDYFAGAKIDSLATDTQMKMVEMDILIQKINSGFKKNLWLSEKSVRNRFCAFLPLWQKPQIVTFPASNLETAPSFNE